MKIAKCVFLTNMWLWSFIWGSQRNTTMHERVANQKGTLLCTRELLLFSKWHNSLPYHPVRLEQFFTSFSYCFTQLRGTFGMTTCTYFYWFDELPGTHGYFSPRDKTPLLYNPSTRYTLWVLSSESLKFRFYVHNFIHRLLIIPAECKCSLS